MATLNGMYVFVDSEDISNDVEVTSHSVEQGMNLTDNVRRTGKTLSIKGYLVGESVHETSLKIEELQNKGSLVDYRGDFYFTGLLITSFKKSTSQEASGALAFTMELSMARIAESAYVPPPPKPPKAASNKNASNGKTKKKTNAGTKQTTKKSTKKWVYHTVKKGDTVWALVNGPYKSLKSTCDQVMNWNPTAFSRKGDFRTLQIGKKLKMGQK